MITFWMCVLNLITTKKRHMGRNESYGAEGKGGGVEERGILHHGDRIYTTRDNASFEGVHQS